MLANSFDPAEAETRISAKWAEDDWAVFKPSGAGEPFTIVIPPPNVTGSLHMGHALNNTLQDALARFWRMRGRSVLWQPGMDHAGIATQMVVERQLAERQQKRTDFTREEFVAKVWEWKADSGGTIIGQLKRLGASCDWSRERFTMDEGLSAAVRRVFVQLFNEKLIYRDKRLVNWDPKFETAISDLEVENTEVDGHFWHFKYPLENGETYQFPIAFDENGNATEWETRDYISIATTRPETMLGDGAVAVHPSDMRYEPIVDKHCHIPVGDENGGKGRLIPIIADDYPDPDFGSGAVKITGAHDFNDYKVAKKHGLPMLILMDEKARMRDDDHGMRVNGQLIDLYDDAFANGGVAVQNVVPQKYRGLDRYEARRAIVSDIDARGLLIKVEDKKIMQPVGDRSGVVIEPMLTDQWYVDAEKLARRAIEAVEAGETRFVPENWTKTYFQWMRNIEPWCVSRQLWWGHRIPVWYGTAITTVLGKLKAQGMSPDAIQNILNNRDFAHQNPNEVQFGPDNPFRNSPVDEAFGCRDGLIIFCAENEAEAISIANEYLQNKLAYLDLPSDTLDVCIAKNGTDYFAALNEGFFPIQQDEDVLDTWFSSALWPFSTLGWPEGASPPPLAGEVSAQRTEGVSSAGEPPSALRAASPASGGRKGAPSLLHTHYPTSVLVTAHDIIFFWVARMMMMGLHFMKEVPFRDVYIHALVLDEKGQKMSKSKGNVIDPLTLIDKYGADALRFTLAAQAAQGRNIRLSEARVEGYRNFTTKLWNAARFGEMNGTGYGDDFGPSAAQETLNRWIAHEANLCVAEVTAAMEGYRFNDAAGAIYKFAWNVYCDWYVELSKPILMGADGPAKDETRAMAAWVYDVILRLLHPFMPFVTEELWGALRRRQNLLIVERWPEVDARLEAPAAAADINWMIGLITEVRSLRAEMNVPAAAKIPLAGVGLDGEASARLAQSEPLVMRLARIERVERAEAPPKGAVQFVHAGSSFALPLAGFIDFAAERVRLAREIEKAEKEIAGLDARLGNPSFIERAPAEVIDENRARRADLRARADKLKAASASLAE